MFLCRNIKWYFIFYLYLPWHMILIMLYSLTMIITGYKSSILLIRLSACLEQTQQSEWSDNFNRERQDLFRMYFTAYGGQVASHHGDNQVARLGKAKSGEWFSNRSTEWFMPTATFFKFWLIFHEMIAWNTSKQFLYSLFLCLADRRVSQYWNIQFEPSICDAHCTIRWGQ